MPLPSTSSRLPSVSRRGQRGVAALAVALIIVVVATIVTVGVAQVGANDQKGMANEFRSRQAGSVAEVGVERGVLYLRKNKNVAASTAAGGWMNAGNVKWAPCDAATVTLPCGDGKTNLFDNNWTAFSDVPNLGNENDTLSGTVAVHYVARAAVAGNARPGSGVFHVIASGVSADAGGVALVRKTVTFFPFLAHRPDAPLIAAGTINIGGTLSVVANPNGGGTGVPLSMWSETDADLAGGTMQTCHISEYLSTDGTYSEQNDAYGNTLTMCPACECPNAADLQISNSGKEGIDILDVDQTINGGPSNADVNPDSVYFPDDMFQYTFGVPEDQYATVKSQAQIIADCSTLGPTSAGLIWITGDCEIPSNTTVGSFESPVLLVVEDGDFRMNANSAYLGVIFLFQRTGTYNVQINGGPTLYGAMISTGNIDLGNGNYTARYDRMTLDNLARGGANAASGMAEVPGAWVNYQAP